MKRKATSVEALPDLQLRVFRNDGSTLILDLKPYLERGVFRGLREPGMLAEAKLDPLGGVEWPCGASLPPELLAADHSPATGKALQRS
jgi:hypothetical protein